MSPYVVTTWTENVSSAAHAEGYTREIQSRRASATRDDAAQAVFDLVEGRYPLSELSEAIALEIKRTPTTTSYTLPDGTLIEVAHVQPGFLAHTLSMRTDTSEREVIAAFNAQEAAR